MTDKEDEGIPLGRILGGMFGKPPTAEERVAIQKERQAEARAALPLGEEILEKLREFEALTHAHGSLSSLRRALAAELETLRFNAHHLDPDCSQ